MYSLGRDQEIIPLVSSVNIACGFHAGDPSVMRQTVALAMENKTAIGAHPGFFDLMGFGRRKMQVSSQEAYDLVLYQIGALWIYQEPPVADCITSSHMVLYTIWPQWMKILPGGGGGRIRCRSDVDSLWPRWQSQPQGGTFYWPGAKLKFLLTGPIWQMGL